MLGTSAKLDFRALHAPGDPFILMNAWDRGSAKLLATLGAQAIATTSGGHAFTLGRVDMGRVTRDEALAHAQDLVSAVKVPVSGDFENGYGHAPDAVATTVTLAAEVGLAGCSIEDTHLPDPHPYAFDLAVERIRAASAAARALPQDFVLVARADGLMNATYDVKEAERRLQAFAAAGADCVYAPMPETLADLQRLARCTNTPFNALALGAFATQRRADFAAMGVARLSLGSGLLRRLQATLLRVGQRMLTDGDFADMLDNASGDHIDKMMEDPSP